MGFALKQRRGLGAWVWGLAVVLTGMALAGSAAAVAPHQISYQGQVLDPSGAPMEGPVDIWIAIYDQPTAGIELYYEEYSSVPLSNGVFDIQLGSNPSYQYDFDPGSIFGGADRYLQVWVNGEALTPRQEFGSAPYAFQCETSESANLAGTATYADLAGDADTVDGHHASALNQSAHVTATDNPHGVTAAQVGAASSADLASHSSNASAHHVKTTSFAELTGQIVDAQIPSSITRDIELDAQVAALQSQVATLQANLDTLGALLVGIERNGNDLIFSGMNVQVVNGRALTSTTNGLGNLIVGYNEDGYGPHDRAGSHNLIVGNEHSYSSYGGFVAGHINTISAPHASVTGGRRNTVSGEGASVSGGLNNTAAGLSSAVGGGEENWAGNVCSGNPDRRCTSDSDCDGFGVCGTNNLQFVTGGSQNTASGANSSIAGGEGNRASGEWSSVTGGSNNEASADHSSVTGGLANSASGNKSSVSGGENNDASGVSSSISGGSQNQAATYISSVGGGHDNWAGNVCSGGSEPESRCASSSDCDGGGTCGDAWYQTVSGGYMNTAGGQYSSVSGGHDRTAAGQFDWRAGSLLEDF